MIVAYFSSDQYKRIINRCFKIKKRKNQTQQNKQPEQLRCKIYYSFLLNYKNILNNIKLNYQFIINNLFRKPRIQMHVQEICHGNNSIVVIYGDDEKSFALKMVPHHTVKIANNLRNEYQVLSKLDHPGIIKVIKYKQKVVQKSIGENKQIEMNMMLMENARHGNLLQFLRLRHLQIAQKRHLFQDIVEAVEYLHCKGIVHRDIKLQNILVDEVDKKAVIKLGDFGFATSFIQDGEIKYFNALKGTKKGFMAPQIHQIYYSQNKFYDATKADIFAIGVTLFYLIFGKLPFQFAKQQDKYYKHIINRDFQKFWSEHIGELTNLQLEDHSMVDELKDLFQSLVCYNPLKRITIEEIFIHPWLQGSKRCVRLQQK